MRSNAPSRPSAAQGLRSSGFLDLDGRSRRRESAQPSASNYGRERGDLRERETPRAAACDAGSWAPHISLPSHAEFAIPNGCSETIGRLEQSSLIQWREGARASGPNAHRCVVEWADHARTDADRRWRDPTTWVRAHRARSAPWRAVQVGLIAHDHRWNIRNGANQLARACARVTNARVTLDAAYIECEGGQSFSDTHCCERVQGAPQRCMLLIPWAQDPQPTT